MWVSRRGHEKLTTFGLLKEASSPEVRGYIEQLIGQDFLQQIGMEFPTLALTERGVAVLKDPGHGSGLMLVRQRRPVKGHVQPRARIETESWDGVDRDLFERLRALRLEIARARGVPPYVIFHDTTLRDMARLKPRSMEALRGVYGVGERKAADLGPRFIEAIAGSP